MAKNILFVINSLPYPLYKDGITLINYRILEKAPTDYRFHIVSFSESDEFTKEKLSKLFPQIIQISCIGSSKHLSDLINLISYVLLGRRIFSSKYKDYICNIDLDSFDLIYFCAPPSPLYFRKISSKTPIFLNAVDSFSLLNERFYLYHKTLFFKLKKWLYMHAEKKCFSEASIVNFVSEIDRKYIFEKLKSNNIISITNGVDLNYFSFNNDNRDEKSILFVGNYNYKPNVEAVIHFVNKIFPILKKRHNGLKFYIVGINPPFNFCSNDIIVTGFVKNVKEYYQRCTLFVSPLTTGSGIKNKILEAMASGIPVVSTSIGADGINGLVTSQNIEIANDSNEMINKIDLLLKNSKLRHILSKNGRLLMETYYSWDSIISQYYQTFESLKK
ncbi:glycosyltransferase [Parabacteroides faecis]|uniref:glycosyltransferase family 4 protein n=1 Tax=Parabacteroides TaxID=375288 RepID=UPI000EFF6390|nr:MULTISPECIES: glycosyltransferase family 4 protein [Parabacteroides]MBC8618446.1 glycosyltransferase [Parabacteroides faecis]RHR94839.1 glycosyltransferase [Parabacteroides sp. AF14-59]